MPFKLDNEGYLVGADGARLRIGTEDVKLEGVFGQDRVDAIVKDRLEREKKKHDEDKKALLASHEEKLRGTLSAEERERLQKEVERLTLEVTDKETLARTREERAKQEAAAEVERYKQRARTWEEKWKHQRVVSDLMAAANDQDSGIVFHDPTDLVNRVLPMVEWKEEVDGAGKPTGEFSYGFKAKVKDEELNKEVERVLDAKGVAALIASKHSHLIHGTGQGGFGGGGGSRNGNGNGPGPGMKLGEMSPEALLSAGYGTARK